MKNQADLMLVAAGILSALLTTACDPAKFQISTGVVSASQNLGQSTVDDASRAICIGHDSETIEPNGGLKGSLYSLAPSQPRYSTSTDYVAHGKKVAADLFMGKVYLPTQVFTNGFTMGGSTLLDESGQNLIEYFAFQLQSKLKLGQNDPEGDYQLAVLSDDGSTLYEVDANGNKTSLVENEGEHSTGLGCALSTVNMTANGRLPIELNYFQGPRQHIALIVMWRHVPSGQSLNDIDCGRSNIQYFDLANGGAQTAAYQALLQRGWKPLTNSNFELMSGTNPCRTTH